MQRLWTLVNDIRYQNLYAIELRIVALKSTGNVNVEFGEADKRLNLIQDNSKEYYINGK